jgi:hypothetical protein
VEICTVHVVAFLAGLLCCLGVALDAFQTIILPRRPTGRYQITRLFFMATWAPWVVMAERAGNKKVREQIYSIYGPLSLLLLLLLWALLLICGFGLFYFSMRSPFGDLMMLHTGSAWAQFGTDLYVSGTTLFTLGLGGVALLDSRAGSPPNAAELFRRHAFEGGQEALTDLLAEWERWSAEILESHISYPILCYYRSQHDNQSWLSALVSILDACALLISVIEGASSRQAQLTFVMARHALVDLGQVFRVQEQETWPEWSKMDRLPAKDFYQLCGALGENHLLLCGDPAAAKRLTTIRLLYEPHAFALSEYLRMPLPVWVAPPKMNDQWSVLTKLRTDAESALKLRSGSLHDE